MRYLVILSSVVFSLPLVADEVVTAEGHSFVGIVREFDAAKNLVLATGYGDLTFEVSRIEDATTTDYTWPKSAGKTPTRAKAFDQWIDERAKEKAAKALTWEQVPKKKEVDEVDFGDFWKLVLEGDPDQSWLFQNRTAKEMSEARKKLQENKKWSYVAFKVDRVDMGGIGKASISADGTLHDARSGKAEKVVGPDGKPAGWSWRLNGLTIDANRELSPEQGDEHNAKKVVDAKEREESAIGGVIDWSHAENLKAGDTIVCRMTARYVEDNYGGGSVVYYVIPVRKTCSAKLEK